MRPLVPCLCLVVSLAVPEGRPAAAESRPAVAQLVAFRGAVSVVRDGQPLAVYPGFALIERDVVQTRDGRALVRFVDATEIRLAPNTRIVASEQGPTRSIDLLAGRLWALVSKGFQRSTSFRSGGTIAAVRGTELHFAVEGEGVALGVFEGQVDVENPQGKLVLAGGQSALAEAGKAPALRLEARPRDAVTWALHYPPVLYLDAARLDRQSWRENVLESNRHFLAGDLEKALGSLGEGEGAGAGEDPFFLAYRASLRLALGRVEDAAADLDRALRSHPDHAEALSLRAVMAVVRDDKAEAMAAARRAVSANPGSAAARVALSYAQQAGFDLEGARASLEEAVKLEPGHALAWARLAELHSSFADLDLALEAAYRATAIEPNLARTQSVLGFAFLTQVRTAEARKAFTRAIELDSSDPLPRLGLGLARIRDGELALGRAEIEIAASLDPNHAIVRSYLGKAYFEEKRAPLDQRQYEAAKELDPQDPTPWFYHAIAKQTTNRPVEALADFQGAIDRNDRRAVYRSRLLLDSDLASRSASLGRVYSDLGFQNLALVEGWHSVNTDPANFSAHRLLADSYAVQPRHEIARVSELLQSQLLQPINTTPIQPMLAESSLFLISAQGPSGLSFNEFSPLFNRDGLRAQVSALGGERDTWSGEAIVSGIHKKASFSAAYNRFKSEGFRVNEEQDDEIANAFVQVELSPETSIQGEVRRRELESGDLALRFHGGFSPVLQETTETTNVRAGLRHAVSPGAVVLVSYQHQEKDVAFFDADPASGILGVTLDRDEDGDSFEAQVLLRPAKRLGGKLKLVAGLGHFAIDSLEEAAIEFDAPPPPDGPGPITETFVTDGGATHTNLYGYSTLDLTRQLVLALGLSADLFEQAGDVGVRDQLNPKAGISWTPRPGTTVRGAAFRALKRTLLTTQTLEPTQVAGFNQFYDDPDATESRHYGAAIDQKFTGRAFVGAALSRRDLDVPYTLFGDAGQIIRQRRDWEERVARAYLFVAPHARLALSAEYEYEHLERDARDPNTPPPSFSLAKTHRLPLAVRLDHPSGIGATLKATYLDQEGEFALLEPPYGFLPGERDFWTLDATLRYRLPRRHGFLAVGASNLTDQDLPYEATDAKNPTIRPGRAFFARMTLTWP